MALEALFAESGHREVLAAHVAVGHDNTAAQALYGGFGLRAPGDGRVMLSARTGSGPGAA